MDAQEAVKIAGHIWHYELFSYMVTVCILLDAFWVHRAIKIC
jgi:hypothetical protein